MKLVGKLALTLTAVGVVAAVCLGLAYTVTRKNIGKYDRQVEAKASKEAFPLAKSADEIDPDPKLLDKVNKDKGIVQKAFTREVENVFAAPGGYVFKVKVKGYGGPVQMMVGISNRDTTLDGKQVRAGEVVGISKVSSTETEGLGSKAFDPAFTDQFTFKPTPEDGYVVVKNKGNPAPGEINTVTGATISSKAVTDAVHLAVESYRSIKDGQ